jgi:predicted nucleic-acid-binding protein
VIGLDTNVLVRYVTRDQPDMAAAAKRVIDSCTEEGPAFVTQATLAELHWVLRRSYQYSAAEALAVVEGLLSAREIWLEDEESVDRAVRSAKKGADFADALIGDVALLFGCETVLTFDKRAARFKPFVLLED